jgi:PTH1 family peptidyl-tRNA hydrolase
MALFQKNPFRSDSNKPLYTLGLNKTVVIVGLGNPGKKYEKTRHNIGFVCVDAFAKEHEFEKWFDKKDLRCQMAAKTLGDTRVILLKPTTMMNLSGEAVQAVAHFYKVEPSVIVAVYDEFAVPFGQIRTRIGGSSAGHNGVKSLIQHIGDGFGRVRVGIQNDSEAQMDMADYVLANFNEEELAQVTNLTREVNSILTEYVFSGQLPHETRHAVDF